MSFLDFLFFFTLLCFYFTFTCYYLGEQRFIYFFGGFSATCTGVLPNFLFFFTLCPYFSFGDQCLPTGIEKSSRDIFLVGGENMSLWTGQTW